MRSTENNSTTPSSKTSTKDRLVMLWLGTRCKNDRFNIMYTGFYRVAFDNNILYEYRVPYVLRVLNVVKSSLQTVSAVKRLTEWNFNEPNEIFHRGVPMWKQCVQWLQYVHGNGFVLTSLRPYSFRCFSYIRFARIRKTVRDIAVYPRGIRFSTSRAEKQLFRTFCRAIITFNTRPISAPVQRQV